MKTNLPKRTTSPAVTHEGAPAQNVSPSLELRRTVMNCLLFEDQFYETGESIAQRIFLLCQLVSPQEVAMLAIEARERMRLRHAPLWLLRCLLEHRGWFQPIETGFEATPWTLSKANAIARVVTRPDQAGELISLYWKGGDKRATTLKLPHALLRGLAKAFQNWDAYQLSKWNREAAIRLKDVMFLCHPKPKDEAQAALFKQLADDELPPADTWEVALSAKKGKKETFERLLREKKLPGMATLMNLRNMLQAKVDVDLLKERLRAGIKMALPFRFLTAARYAPALEPELDQAMLLSMAEFPMLAGATLILVDVSGSMDTVLSAKAETTRVDAACGLAIHLREKCSDAVVVATFSNRHVIVPPRRGMALRDAITQSQPHAATFLELALTELKKTLEPHRIIVVTDEQAHDGIIPCWAKHGYVINVGSYRHGLSYGNGWHHIDGFSERVMDWILEVEHAVPQD